MGKHHFRAAVAFGRGHSRCLGCQRPIVYGERCPDCASELRKRKRRKQR